jgi:hypothetical protein
MIGKYYLSEDEESYSIGPYNTRQEAIDAAPEELGHLEPGSKFCVGVSIDPAGVIGARLFLDALQSYVDDNAPVHIDAEFSISSEARNDLDRLLKDWARHHGVRPNWWNIQDVTEHVLPSEVIS